MLFNSFQFLFGFLPVALAVYFGVSRLAPSMRLTTLLALSFLFYGYWDWRFVPLLAASILVNWVIALIFSRTTPAALIALAIAANLAVLGFFKYYNFLSGLLPMLEMPHIEIALPLGISFFTFHHIMYLADLRAGTAPQYDLVRYVLYISFFPQILSGPLVRWREVMHQFDVNPFSGPDQLERCVRGVVLLIIGLCEKTLLGDNLARIATPIFTASNTASVSFSDAWLGTLAFAFQIYFDFAGYTDMAIGTAMLFGIILPQNFNAPYRATSLQDFWRRWHMTLSRFLRNYLYIPLGGSKYGLAVQLWALFATMALGGLWHGAGLNFIAWGILHGVGLGVGVLWRRAGLTLPVLAGAALTFLFVMLCWVLFRSNDFASAFGLYRSLIGMGEIGRAWPIMNIILLIVAGTIAIAAPSAWDLALGLRPSRRSAIASGILLALALLALNTGDNFEFIYFRF
jgi:alginate O-acetyltransferase complex protein AlgI